MLVHKLQLSSCVMLFCAARSGDNDVERSACWQQVSGDTLAQPCGPSGMQGPCSGGVSKTSLADDETVLLQLLDLQDRHAEESVQTMWDLQPQPIRGGSEQNPYKAMYNTLFRTTW